MQTQHITKYSTLINVTPEKVWDALTNPAMVKQYSFEKVWCNAFFP